MSLIIGDNFSYQGKQSNFDRDSFDTLEKMKNYLEDSLDEGHISYCKETSKHYIYHSTNSIDPILGKWRLAVDTSLDETSENPVQNKKIFEKFKSTEETFSKKIDEISKTTGSGYKELSERLEDDELTTSAALNELNTYLEESNEVISAAINDINVSKLDKTVTINGHGLEDGDLSLSKSDIGLGNVDNTSDINKPVSTATKNALNTKVDKVSGHSLIDSANLNKLKALPTKDELDTASKLAKESLKNHVENYNNPHKVSATQLGLGKWTEYSPTNLPISVATQNALDLKVDKTTTINGKPLENNINLSKIDLSLGNVDNTSDLDKPVSKATKKEFEELYGILYNQMSNTSLWSNVSGNVIEKGINKEITLNWNYKFNGVIEKPDSMKLISDEVVLVNSVDTTTYKETISNTKSYRVEADKKGCKKSSGITINAYYPKYFGSSDKTTLISSDITSMNKQAIKSNASGEYSFAVGKNQYAWFCVPSGMKIKKVTSGGFEVPLEKSISVMVDGKSTYDCYRSSKTFKEGTFNCKIEI